MQIPKGLLVAAGLGAVGIGGYMLLKGGDKKEGADPASKDVDPALAGGGKEQAGPTAANPTGGLPGAGAALPGAQDPAAAGGAGAGAGGGAQQVGPYTIIPDPASGAQVVFETATKQPVGVLDAQGNLMPVTVDAQGNISVDPTGGAGGAGVTSPTPGVNPAAGSTMSSPTGTSPAGVGAPTGAAEGAQYKAIAESLFANAGDGSAGTAVSSGMTGASSLGATPTGTTTTSTGVGSPMAVSPTATGTTSTSSVPTGATAGAAGGQLAVMKDPASGIDVVVDTTTGQPVGVIDPQTGQAIPIEALQAQAQAQSGAGALAPATGTTTTAPVGAGAGLPIG